jgi:starch synthase
VEVLAVDAPGLFGSRTAIYGHPDDDVRFVVFAKAVARLAAAGPPADVLHLHDWHLGAAPAFARHGPDRAALARTATVLTIHNVAYKGPLSKDGRRAVDRRDGFRDTLLARGIRFSDAVTTVSRRYLGELLTPTAGMGLDRLLARRRPRLAGIRNGVDYDTFDPARDAALPVPFDAASLDRRALVKRAVQRRSGLVERADVPVVAMVARLVDQKGFDLVLPALDRILALGYQLVVAGVGEERYRRRLEEAARHHRGRVAYLPDDGEAAARLLYGGADVLLAPSLFEPCGLGPLIGLRYGAIPVVRRTGGLAETIADVREAPGSGLGFAFSELRPEPLLAALAAAAALHRQPGAWRALQRRGMAADFSWGPAAAAYERLFAAACVRRRRVVDAVVGAREAEELSA